ncbi:unnamed protein product [Trichobilharzia szidati]|nr:unnamed protein product [Trichobilharzia szidati]
MSVSPVVPHVTCVYNFKTYMHGITEITSNNFSVTSLNGEKYKYEQVSYGNYSTNTSVINLKGVPDLSIWDDRSVLILAVHRLNFSTEPTCPEVYLCAIPNVRHKRTSECETSLGEVSGSCQDEIDETHFFLFPLASSLKISVGNVGHNADSLSSSMHIVVTAGYRLPPTAFTCPSGYFACQLFNRLIEPRYSPLNWTYRICLPLDLWCDGVPNCPVTGSDEENCSAVPPNSYVYLDSQFQSEYQMLSSVLDRYAENTSLLRLTGFHKISDKPSIFFASLNTVWYSLGLLSFISVIAVLTIAFKLSKKKRGGNTVQVVEEKSYAEISHSSSNALKNNIDNSFSDIDCYEEKLSSSNNDNNNNICGANHKLDGSNNVYHHFPSNGTHHKNFYGDSVGCNRESVPLIHGQRPEHKPSSSPSYCVLDEE